MFAFRGQLLTALSRNGFYDGYVCSRCLQFCLIVSVLGDERSTAANLRKKRFASYWRSGPICGT